MDIHLRKIHLVQAILNIQNEEIIIGFEKLLAKINTENNTEGILPMSLEEFNERIDKSEKDFIEGNFIDADTLFAKYL